MTASRAVVVTGASGLIGRQAVATLREHGHRVGAIEHRWADRAELDALLAGHRHAFGRIDVVLHLGWYAQAADYATNEVENERSAAATVELGRTAADHDVELLVAAGSSAEYGDSPRPHQEGEEPQPDTAYARAKVAAHEELLGLEQAGGTPVAWARIFHVVGPGEHAGRVTSLATRAMLDRQPVDLSSGRQLRDVVDVVDVAGALVALVESGVPGTVNICRGEAVSLRSLLLAHASAVEALDTDGSADLLNFGGRPDAPGDHPALIGDPGRIRSTTGWEPTIDLATTASRLVAHHLSPTPQHRTKVGTRS